MEETQRMNPHSPIYVDRSPIHGQGLFAAQPIAAGGYIGSYEGPEVTEDGCYVLWVYEDAGPVGREGTNELRYLNHSDQPNAEFDGFDLFSLRDIASGEEITIDYQAAD